MNLTFGVVGHPVAHSLSPAMFEAAFFTYNIEAEYRKFDVAPENLGKFLDEARLNSFQGLSITVPHKEAIIPFLDSIDEKAKIIGAVNTVVNAKGKLKGYNTDWIGAQRALEELTALQDKRVLIIGAGGAATAIIYACLQAGAQVTILNRDKTKAEVLAEKFREFSTKQKMENTNESQGHEIVVGEFDNILSYPADILIHTTSIGMWPNIDASVVPREYFKKGLVVFDIVYNPLQTKLVKEAAAAGCKIVPGYKMLLYQAEKQFELWFKKKPPLQVMEKALLEALRER